MAAPLRAYNASKAASFIYRLKAFFSRFRRGEGKLVKKIRSGLLSYEEVQREVELLTVEEGVLKTALRLVEKARERGLLTEEEERDLTSKYHPLLEGVGRDLAKRKGILTILDLEAAKKGLEQSYRRKISSFEKKIQEIEESLSSETLKLDVGEKEVDADFLNQTSLTDRIPKGEYSLSGLKDEVRRAMQRLEQIEVEA